MAFGGFKLFECVSFMRKTGAARWLLPRSVKLVIGCQQVAVFLTCVTAVLDKQEVDKPAATTGQIRLTPTKPQARTELERARNAVTCSLVGGQASRKLSWNS